MLFLVVDDDALSRDLLTVVLEAEGYEVEVAASGEVAVERAACGVQEGLPSFDAVLTDIQMPGLAGAALAAALRPLMQGDTRLLAMSGSQPAASELAGFDGFLLKPFKVSQLRAMISPSQLSTGVLEAHTKEVEPDDGTAPAALDEEIYEKMSELMPIEQLGQMYELCLNDARKRIAHMRELAPAGDDARYRSEAHAVKGGCGMIGASELHALAAAAEQEGLGPDTEIAGTSGVTATLARLSHACDRLERILQERTR